MAFSIDEVFNPNAEAAPASYVERGVDATFKRFIERRELIVVHGPSKQGKTTLWRKHLDPHRTVNLNCDSETTCLSLVSEIAERIGLDVGQNEVLVRGDVGPDFLRLATETKTIKQGNGNTRNAVADGLKASKSIVVIDDIHVLPIDELSRLATFGKLCVDRGAKIVLIGAWHQEMLSLRHPDLAGRVVGIDAGKWTPGELRQLLINGQDLLNICFDEGFVDALVEAAQGSPFIVHRVCSTLPGMPEKTWGARRHPKKIEAGAGDVGSEVAALFAQMGNLYQQLLRLDVESASNPGARALALGAILTCDPKEMKRGASLAVLRDRARKLAAAFPRLRGFIEIPQSELLEELMQVCRGSIRASDTSIRGLNEYFGIRSESKRPGQSIFYVEVLDPVFVAWRDHIGRNDQIGNAVAELVFSAGQSEAGD